MRWAAFSNSCEGLGLAKSGREAGRAISRARRKPSVVFGCARPMTADQFQRCRFDKSRVLREDGLGQMRKEGGGGERRRGSRS